MRIILNYVYYFVFSRACLALKIPEGVASQDVLIGSTCARMECSENWSGNVLRRAAGGEEEELEGGIKLATRILPYLTVRI